MKHKVSFLICIFIIVVGVSGKCLKIEVIIAKISFLVFRSFWFTVFKFDTQIWKFRKFEIADLDFCL